MRWRQREGGEAREDGGEMRSEDEALRVSLLHLLTRVPQLCLFVHQTHSVHTAIETIYQQRQFFSIYAHLQSP